MPPSRLFNTFDKSYTAQVRLLGLLAKINPRHHRLPVAGRAGGWSRELWCHMGRRAQRSQCAVAGRAPCFSFVLPEFQTQADSYRAAGRRCCATAAAPRWGCCSQIGKIPKITPLGAGYLKMTMTAKMRDLVLDW